jgi:hypothetical protein
MGGSIITKTMFMSGVQCTLKLWHEQHADSREPPSESTLRAMAEGNEVGALARAQYPGGVFIAETNYEAAAAATREAYENGASVIYEAAFLVDDMYAKVDILHIDEEGNATIIEVKATTSVKPEHLPDVGFQWHVVVASGINVTNVYLMILDDTKLCPSDNYFKLEDVAEKAQIWKDAAQSKSVALMKTANQATQPTQQIGSHCNTPYDCQFTDKCWAHVPDENSIFTIPFLRGRKKQDLIDAGIFHINHLPTEFEATAAQQVWIDVATSGKPIVNIAGIKDELSQLEYPLAHFDFETMAYAIPRFAGMKPYQQFPFQFSLHVQRKNGKITHQEYLHVTRDDPRKHIAEAMLASIPDGGHIITWNKHFESGRIMEMAAWLESTGEISKANQMRKFNDRLWDLAEIFRIKGTGEVLWLHPDMQGRYSIKYVLPVIAPHLSYKGMKVAKGDEAMNAWAKLIMLPDGSAEKQELTSALLAYCKQDTYAMVVILDYLWSLVWKSGL